MSQPLSSPSLGKRHRCHEWRTGRSVLRRTMIWVTGAERCDKVQHVVSLQLCVLNIYTLEDESMRASCHQSGQISRCIALCIALLLMCDRPSGVIRNTNWEGADKAILRDDLVTKVYCELHQAHGTMGRVQEIKKGLNNWKHCIERREPILHVFLYWQSDRIVLNGTLKRIL